MRPILTIAALACLTGCSMDSFTGEERAAIAPVAAPACPSIKIYTLAQQQAIGRAEEALQPDSALHSPLLDWVRMRAWARGCAAVTNVTKP